LITGFMALALLVTGTPAQASSMSWSDDVDEPILLAQGSLDITKVTLDYDGKTFSVVLQMKQLGDPAPFGTGQWYGFRFNYGENQYTMRLTQDRIIGDAFQFQQKTGDAEVTGIPCKTCKFKLDREASQVRMEIGFESLKSALRKLEPGQSIDALLASTGPAYSEPSGTFGTVLWAGNPGDSSTHPDGESFTF
jgi:hypothetical protein